MDIVDVLQAAIKRRSGWFPPVGEVWGLLFGRAGNSKIPLIFFMSSVLLWSYPMYVIRVSISCICFVCMYMTANCNFYNFSRWFQSPGIFYEVLTIVSFIGTQWCGSVGWRPIAKIPATFRLIPNRMCAASSKYRILTSGRNATRCWIGYVTLAALYDQSERSIAGKQQSVPTVLVTTVVTNTGCATVACPTSTIIVRLFTTAWDWKIERGFSCLWWVWPLTVRTLFTLRPIASRSKDLGWCTCSDWSRPFCFRVWAGFWHVPQCCTLVWI